jgi:FMN phosphatase YigB (HAD superfamily)
MIGDSWASDIVGARNAGIRALWFNRSGAVAEAGIEVDEIASFEPVEPVVKWIFTPTEH